MRGLFFIALCAFASISPVAVTPASAEFRPIEMAIPFANFHGIKNWQMSDADTLYVQDSSGNWYRAELMGAAPSLRFADMIGFEVSPSGRFDRWSSVVLGGQRYYLKSFTASGPPLPKDLRKEFG